MVDHQEEQNSGQVNANPSVISVETDNHQTLANNILNKKEASSSSSTSSEDIDDDDFFQIEGPILGTTISFSENASVKDIRQDSNGSSSNPETGSPIGPRQSPPVQAMSRASDECPDPRRIPSSVFSRSKSSTPADWSVTSNESLFSINVGNASFSKDHFFMYGKSGELGNPNDPLAPLPPLPRPSPTSSPMKSEAVKTAGLTNANVKPTSTKDGDQDADANTDYIHSMSHRSDASTTSFAFPILAGGDTRSSESLEDDEPELAQQSTAQLTEKAEPQIDQPTPKVEDEAPKDESISTSAPAPAPAEASTQQPQASTKWFPWCSCCPSCC